MNQKELNELRRHLSPSKCGISKLYGCYVSGGREIISQFQASLGLLSEFEGETYLALLKKSLSGALGKNLLDLSFSTQQVVDSPEHKRLSALRESKLEDPGLREDFFQTIIDALSLGDTPYLILLAHDTYDVPYWGKDDEDQADASDQVFSYLLCAICPVKEEKPALAYAPQEKTFLTRGISQILSAPVLGFLFPTFDDRAANLYHALYYTKSEEESHQELIDALFCTGPLLSAAQQRETFQNALTSCLNESCSYDVVQGVHEQLRERIEQHKESKDPAPLDLSVRDMGAMLRESGVAEEQIQAFEETCLADLGEGAVLSPGNLMDSKQVKVETPQLRLSLDPESSSLVEARVIHGRKFLLLPVPDEVTVNGIPIHFPEEA